MIEDLWTRKGETKSDSEGKLQINTFQFEQTQRTDSMGKVQKTAGLHFDSLMPQGEVPSTPALHQMSDDFDPYSV